MYIIMHDNTQKKNKFVCYTIQNWQAICYVVTVETAKALRALLSDRLDKINLILPDSNTDNMYVCTDGFSNSKTS